MVPCFAVSAAWPPGSALCSVGALRNHGKKCLSTRARPALAAGGDRWWPSGGRVQRRIRRASVGDNMGESLDRQLRAVRLSGSVQLSNLYVTEEEI